MTQLGTEVQIRMGAGEDAAVIVSVLARAFADYVPLYTREAYAATTPGVNELAVGISEGPVWLALRGEETVGTVSVLAKSKRHVYPQYGSGSVGRGAWNWFSPGQSELKSPLRRMDAPPVFEHDSILRSRNPPLRSVRIPANEARASPTVRHTAINDGEDGLGLLQE